MPPCDVFSAMGVEQMGLDMEGLLEPRRPAPPRRAHADRGARARGARPATRRRRACSDKRHDRARGDPARRGSPGIVFLDELDKVIGADGGKGPDVSRGGVQRDLLPLVEGCTVNTRHGAVRTDHILFIAAGAFHDARPEDLMPELQGRFPLRVSLDPLSGDDFERILTEPENALTKQYALLLGTDGVDLRFTREGVEEIAALGARLNTEKADIGARRLHMVLERLLEEVSFDAPENGGRVEVDAAYVLQRTERLSR